MLEYQIAMVPQVLAVVNQRYPRVVAAEAAVLPRLLQSVKPGYLINPAGTAKGIPADFDPVEDSLATRACICKRMSLRTTDSACITGHGGIISDGWVAADIASMSSIMGVNHAFRSIACVTYRD